MTDLTTATLREIAEGMTRGDWRAQRDPCHFDTLSDVVAGDGNNGAYAHHLMVSVGGNARLAEQESNTRAIALTPALIAEVLSLREQLEAASEDFEAANARVIDLEGVLGGIISKHDEIIWGEDTEYAAAAISAHDAACAALGKGGA